MLARLVRQEVNKYVPSSIASCSYSTSENLSKVKNMVTLNNLPTSTTYADIRNLCFRSKIGTITESDREYTEGINEVDFEASNFSGNKRPSESKRMSILRDMVEISFHRTKSFRPIGGVTILFRNEASASLFQWITKDGIIGGQTINAQVHDSEANVVALLPRTATNSIGRIDPSRPLDILAQAQKETPGRVVLLKGLPYHVTSHRLERILRPSYQLANDVADTQKTSNVETRPEKGRRMRSVIRVTNPDRDEYTASFLVRLQTVSDAMRLVRNWHRSKWDRSSGFERKKQNLEYARRRKSEKGTLNDQYAFEENSMAETMKPESGFQPVEEKRETPEERDEALWQTPLIIDAIIMY